MKICDSWMKTNATDSGWKNVCPKSMKICRRPWLGISYQLLRQKPWRYYTDARVQAGRRVLCVRVWTFDSSSSASSLRICGLMQIWFSRKLPWSAFFSSFSFFFWWQFCVLAKVAILDPLQRFSQIWLQAKYQSNVLQKTSCYIFDYYLLETCIEIWRFFFNLGRIIAIENLKKENGEGGRGGEWGWLG